jgi:hypothetical protein
MHPIYQRPVLFAVGEEIRAEDKCSVNYNNCVLIPAAARLAAYFAHQGQRGFEVFHKVGARSKGIPYKPEKVEEECLARLCLVAQRVPKAYLKAASHCGGLPVVPGLTNAPTPGAKWADGGNALYAAFVGELLDLRPMPKLPEYCGGGFNLLCSYNAEKRGDVVEATLAAADCAKAAMLHIHDPRQYPDWVRDYRDIEGGGYAHGDVVTKWMCERMLHMIAEGRHD